MKFTYACKKVSLSESIKSYAEKKISKLERYLHDEDATAHITFAVEKDHLFGRRAAEVSVVINARLLCPPALAEQIMKGCIVAAGNKHNLDTMIFSVASM